MPNCSSREHTMATARYQGGFCQKHVGAPTSAPGPKKLGPTPTGSLLQEHKTEAAQPHGRLAVVAGEVGGTVRVYILRPRTSTGGLLFVPGNHSAKR